VALAVRHAAFEEVQRQERVSGFIETPGSAKAFFRRGCVGAWRDELAPADADLIEAHNREIMARLGYR
jgi:hypothetical protein